MRGQGSGGDGQAFLGRQGTGNCQHGHDHTKAAEPHHHGQQAVVERCVDRQTGKGAAVVVAGRAQRIQDFGKTMGAGVGNARLARITHHCNGGAHQYQNGRHQNRHRGQLHLVRLDLFAQVFRCATDHQPGNKHGQNGKYQHAVEAGADTAKHHLAQLHHHHRHHAAHRGE